LLNSALRVVSAFLIVGAFYTAYAATLVPLIEPSERPTESGGGSPIRRIADSLEKQRELLSHWFHADDWEMNAPMVFETDQGMLLFSDYQMREHGYVEIRPCSMIFMSKQEGESEADRYRKAVVLRAPQGALLRFDPPPDFNQGRIGRFVGGELLGQVDIHSGQRSVGPEDDLHVTTRDVVMTETDITTPHRMDFTLGRHHGSGVGVHIHLDTAARTDGNGPDVRGVQTFTLEHQVFFHLQPSAEGDLFPGAPMADVSAPPQQVVTVAAVSAVEASPPPVEVRSAGPFTFDFVVSTAMFRQQVDVQRLHPDGTRDTMTGDQLKIFFIAQANDSPAASATKGPSVGGRKLDPNRIELVGEPVVIRAQANGLQARSQFVEHDLATREVHLRDASEVIVRQGERELRAPELFMRPDESGNYGTFRAVGQGRFDGKSVDDPTQAFHAEWTSHVHFRKHEDRHVLSAYGAARVSAIGKGSLAGDEIHLWLKESPSIEPAGGVAVGAKAKTELAPDRLLALGSVQIDSPQLVGAVQRVEAWFEHETVGGMLRKVGFRGEPVQLAQAEGPAIFFGAAPQALPQVPFVAELPQAVEALPAADPIAPAAAALPPSRQFRLDGELLRLQIGVVDRVMQVREAIVERNVRLVEINAQSPTAKPVTIQGDVLHMLQPTPTESFVSVTGAPAFVEAQDMTISGGKLTLRRPNPNENHTAVEGQGVLTLPVDRDLQGNATAQRETMHLTWQGGMTFDGTVAEFDRGVEGRLTSQYLRTDRLRVTFDGPVGRQEQSQTRPQIAQIDCFDGVLLESRTNAPDGNLAAIDRLSARTLSFNQTSGDFSADGPGEVTSVRRGTAGQPALPGQPEADPNPPIVPDPATAAINYLHVRFHRNVVGNKPRGEMTFHNQVRTLYGPVPDWTSPIDPDRPEHWLPQTVLINCDRMQVFARDDAASGTSYDLVAEGNTLVEGTNFTARAPRLTYAQAKDLLVIEGDGRTDAVLYHQDRAGSPRSDTSARRFMVWPSTNRVQIDGATFLELTPN